MSAVDREHLERDQVEEAAGGLDGILSGASTGMVRRFVPGRAGAAMAWGLARNPGALAARAVRAPRQLAEIALGTSDVAPSPKDRRFADPAWQSNPFLRRLVQCYLTAGTSVSGLVADAGLGWRDEERMRFIVDNLVEAASPSNNPVVSPVAWKGLIDSGGLSVVRGARNMVSDLRTSPRVPAMVDANAFEVGDNLAVSPGSVVHRDEVYELIQYHPTTPRVRTRPVLIVPPTINKYYVLDLAPGRSLVEFLVSQGHQVLLMSWRNPDRRHADWDLDTYGQAVLDALDVSEEVTGADAATLMGVCSGGIISSLVLGHLAANGQSDRVAASVQLVAMLEQGRRNVAGALLDEATATTAIAKSRAQGYLDGRSLAEVFAWMRPTDLIWGYWVNNYLLGKKPPAFDILYWNADATRMTAGLHAAFVEIARDNAVMADAAMMLGTRVEMATISQDTYVVAAEGDHICPWRSCYATTQAVGGDVRFVLSSGGHIAGLVNPVENSRSSYRTHSPHPEDPDAWLEDAEESQGTWWHDFSAWLDERSGPTKKAPATVGGRSREPLAAAPGHYVFDG